MVERRYWDSDCFLGYLQAEEGKVDSCRAVLELADKGAIGIVTSAFTIAEVLKLRPKDQLPASRRAQVEAIFARKSIVTIAVTRRIAEDARDLVWDHGISPKDAIHVASARAAGATVLNTFDRGLIAKSGLIGDRTLTIEPPTVTQGTLDV